MELRIDVDNRRALDWLLGIAERAGDPTRLLDTAANKAVDHIVDAFDSRGFGSWAPNDIAWARAKRGNRVLVNNGNLLASLTNEHHPQAVRRRIGDSLVVSTKHPGAPHLAAGARGMPKRDPVPPVRPSFGRRVAIALLGEIITGREQ